MLIRGTKRTGSVFLSSLTRCAPWNLPWEQPTSWRAGCGRSARPVRERGRVLTPFLSHLESSSDDGRALPGIADKFFRERGRFGVDPVFEPAGNPPSKI